MGENLITITEQDGKHPEIQSVLNIQKQDSNYVIHKDNLYKIIDEHHASYKGLLIPDSDGNYTLEDAYYLIIQQILIQKHETYCLKKEKPINKEIDFFYINKEPYINSDNFGTDYVIYSFYADSLVYKVSTTDNIYYSKLFLDNVVGLSKHLESIKKPKLKQKTYLMKDSLGYTKIGKSIDPKKREGVLNSTVPEIKLFAVCEENIEKKLHNEYAIFNRRGEWFALRDDHIEDIVKKYNFKLLNIYKYNTKKP